RSITVMKKFIVLGLAAMIAFTLAGVQTVRIGLLSQDLAELRGKSAAEASLQEKFDALERQLADNRGDIAALKANVAQRNDELERVVTTVSKLARSASPAYPPVYGMRPGTTMTT